MVPRKIGAKKVRSDSQRRARSGIPGSTSLQRHFALALIRDIKNKKGADFSAPVLDLKLNQLITNYRPNHLSQLRQCE